MIGLNACRLDRRPTASKGDMGRNLCRQAAKETGLDEITNM